MSALTSLYLHIPFCQTKCTYCAFNTYINLDTLIPDFVEALQREIRLVGSCAPNTPIHTVFFGGGTPSLLTPEQIGMLMETIAESFDLRADAEISLEANPNDITEAYLASLRMRGINRLSLGMQSADEQELRLFARRHGNDHIARAVSAAHKAGFDNFNLDLIYGVPHQTLSSWRWSLEQAIALGPAHLSLYALGLEEGTPMALWVNTGHLPHPDDDLAADMYNLAGELLGQAGYRQYEISNWALPGRECRHNLQYWTNEPYLGLGPGAHGYANGIRYETLLSPQRYVRALRSQSDESFTYPLTPAVSEWTQVDQTTEIAETLMMGLRLTHVGIDLEQFQRRFGIDLLRLHGDTLQHFAAQGLLQIADGTVRLTQRGRLLSNIVLRELI